MASTYIQLVSLPSASQAGVFLNDLYFCLFLFVLIMVPKAEGSILSPQSHSCERPGCLSGTLPSPESELERPCCIPSTAQTGVTSPCDCCEARLVEARNQGPPPRGGARAPFTVDTPHLGHQSRATLPQPASYQPREGGQTVGQGSAAPAVYM